MSSVPQCVARNIHNFHQKPLGVVVSIQAWHSWGSRIKPGHSEILVDNFRMFPALYKSPSDLPYFQTNSSPKITLQNTYYQPWFCLILKESWFIYLGCLIANSQKSLDIRSKKEFKNPKDSLKSVVKVPIQKASVSQSVTRQDDGVLPPITFAVLIVLLTFTAQGGHIVTF